MVAIFLTFSVRFSDALQMQINMASRCPWARLWTPLSDDNLLGWVETPEEAEKVRKAFEVKTSLTFVSRRTPASSRHTDACK